MTPLHTQPPRYGRTKKESKCGERGRKTQRGEAGTGEVEEVRHRECVVADAAMGEHLADVGNEGQAARAPQAVDERRCSCEPYNRVGGVGKNNPAARRNVMVVYAFGTGK